MNRITKTSMSTLMGEQRGKVMTLYVPTHRYPAPPNIQEDQTRFKNLVHEGCKQWAEVADPAKVKKVQAELEAKLDDLSFWQENIETLAVYASLEDGIQFYHLPIECEERVNVGASYDVIPLQLIEYMNQPVYVFALAQHTPKLFTADLYGIQQLDVDFPSSPEDALNIDEMFSNSNTIRSGRTAGSNSVPAAPHGQGDSSGAGQEERLTYLRILDEKIHTMKGFDAKRPFIIAATDTEYGDFRALTRSKSLVPEYIAGNYVDAPINDLHEQVVKVLFDVVLKGKQTKALESFEERLGTGKASSSIAAIKNAITQGRVGQLLFPLIDITTDSVADHTDSRPRLHLNSPEYMKLSNLAQAVRAQGGELVPFERNALSQQASVGAVYRY